MRRLPCLLLAIALCVPPVGLTSAAAGTPNTDRLKACAAQWNELKRTGRTGGASYQQFCRSFMTAPAAAPPAVKAQAPTPGRPPAGATARCKDGSFSTTPKGRPGACSGHGGVAEWIDGKA
jgi:hypothetical protein